MPKLIIDGRPVEVPAGTNVLEAARRLGIVIPHFCYHPALPIAGACRLCSVKLLDGPVKGIQMSCSLLAQDAMVVSTTDPEAVKMRSLVIEWLMENHPHDCPVCDEGGECLLQDFTIAGGHGRRRYQGKKRTYPNQYLGEGIYHEMNRCIQCYRCARFYQDYAGGTDFGVTGSAGRVYFGRFRDGALESPFSGNLVDICPTGVFTDKTGRFRARYWDYEFAPSVCPHCSVGCTLSPQCYQREVIKIVARRNDRVNSWFICDRARFDKRELNDPERPRDPMVEGKKSSWDEAAAKLATGIGAFLERHGAEALALVGSPRLTLEAGILLGRLSRELAGSRLCFYQEPDQAERSIAATRTLDGDNAASASDLETAECIALCHCDPMSEGPILALSIRKAWLKGAQVFLVHPDLTSIHLGHLPFEAKVVPTLDDVPISQAKRGVLLCGAGATEFGRFGALARAGVKIAFLQPGPNAFGTALLSREFGAVPLRQAMAEHRIRGVLALEADLPPQLLDAVEFLAVADWRASAPAGKATVFLPTTAWTESNGTYLNFEGRAQRFERAMRAGRPLRGLASAYHAHQELPPPAHPPRRHRAVAPGGEARDAEALLRQLTAALRGEPAEATFGGRWKGLEEIDPEGEGVRIWETDVMQGLP